MSQVTFNQQQCKGCGLCASVCPKQIIALDHEMNENGYITAGVRDMDLCIGCGMCAMICPDRVITVEKETA